MARYIDADLLKDRLDVYEDDVYYFEFVTEYDIDEIPTADVAEVKHGEWVDRDGKTWCSLCDASNKQYKPPYCPHCGAKMDGMPHGGSAPGSLVEEVDE